MNGLQLIARRALLTRMKSSAPLVALVPAASIYSQHVPHDPAWPFIKLGPPQTLPTVGSCLRGGNISILVSAFAKPRRSGGAIVETAEDHASKIGAAIEDTLHLKADNMALPERVRMVYRMADIRLALDGAEMDAFHYSATVQIRAFAR